MYLAEDKPDAQAADGRCGEEVDLAAPAGSPGGKWLDFPNSRISHHGAPCCDIAHEWLLAFDFAQLNGGDVLTGPRWMREHSAWGPSAWPIHWCEAVDARTVDCGVHAAMAHEAFVARGVPAFRAQFVQRYSADAAVSWRANWGEKSVSDHWIDGDAIYHEGNAVLVGADEVKLWDGSAGWWIDPRGHPGYGGLVALRIEADPACRTASFRWGGRPVAPNEWTAI
ncbi:MAG TPA: hypothetical protein VF636_02485 [Sphingomonas sp.]|jgi:hypothetical protein